MNDLAPAPIEFVEAAGARLAVTRRGRGEPVLCLHAIGHGARDFSALAARLGDRFEFIAVDWPGHGQSPGESCGVSIERYGEIAVALLDSIGLDQAVLLGNSIGGAAALQCAAAAGERVRALVLCNAGGLQAVDLLARLYCRHMANFFATGERGDKRFARRFRRYYERVVLPMQAARARREEIIASAYAVAPLLRQAWQSFATSGSDLRSLAPKIVCPVLFAWAKRDLAVNWGRSKHAALSVHNRLVAIFDAGHAAFLEQPDAFDEAFVRFVGA
ncbi:MAG: alpha/beta hydrolase [Proteobacteria bacterium]|nr:alpha/beta hydrolase [Pseudomonadota bacterium]